ncbi:MULTISPECIES: aminotransferase class III-fold pyridoxal phosphate-dependent enzyme [unclassified Chelatococcus]|uniref:aminotransferase class III-fold pyridoxal phosphate-dependent enzyme n=1 Tax=unclassified Chelatococcus TaxID=2638111 RepID=UPI001BCB6FEC|nr:MULTISPECIES: aminotransferase class III-fold pyridoxal phosphate-dependent enzyme [unclassified Chelatococcus]MBS7700271.1 aminotransferase class III-fold pyridoxal phosphate-dependent enzyme [Chelatococcus sp. YT9]MBX3558242.1 aminotransferase class III-fold pyridoxal phosphate-dependent enzyme [Chelatococcus sp.]
MSLDLVSRDAAAFFHQKGSSPCLSALRAVEGIWLEDVDGRRVIDLHGNTAHHVGYRHPEIVAALKRQLDTLPFSPRRYTNEPAVALAEKLLARWPGAPARVLFATGGSDAIEIALKLARVTTGRHETISLEGSYHGHGFGSFGLSKARPDPRLGPFLPGRRHVTPYWAPDGARRMLAEMRAAFEQSQDGIAAVVAEPIRSNCHMPPPGLWAEVRGLCDRHGALLIFDEIPTGLGKTGRFFAFAHVGAVPDAVVLGKALGGGVLPIAAVIADARLNIAPELDLGHYTHEKNPLTTLAALTTIEIIERDRLVERAAHLEQRIRLRVGELARFMPVVRGVRGVGLLLALEFDATMCGVQSGPEFAADLVRAFMEAGLSTTAKDNDSVGFSLPMTVSDAELDLIFGAVQRAAETIQRKQDN